ncbi:MAG TPA: thymidine phosphorylase [Patescibacteria group bacterium]|nr:thymidine phosphorylase [Patescibacteria group bacterium]
MDDKDEKKLALEGIRKKLVGKTLNYKEIFAIMDEIAKKKLGDVLTTYFVASGYSEGFSDEELYYLTRAMVETGEKLEFKGIVADKHSIGGVPGTRVTLILVPIIAAAGFKIPKSSSRAITTPAGTADCMESISDVTFTKDQIYKIVDETGGCIVWGGGFRIAPADDDIIKIEEPLLFESYDKIVVSVMAKKIAFGSTHVVIDLPYGPTVKLHKEEDAEVLGRKFKYLGKRFGVKVRTFIHKMDAPAGFGVGPLLEARDSVKVLEQIEDRPMHLEKLAIDASAKLLDLCLEDSPVHLKDMVKKNYQNTENWATDLLTSGKAFEKFRQIVKAQGGDEDISSSKMHPAAHTHIVKASKSGKIKKLQNINLTVIAKILGAPADKKSGIYLNHILGDEVKHGDDLMTLYTSHENLISESIDSLSLFPIFEIE